MKLRISTLMFAIAPSFAAAATPADGGCAVAAREQRVWMVVGERRFVVELADTRAARAFTALLPLALEMPDLNGNEKQVKLPRPLPTDTVRPGTIRNGDLMLWGADTLVVFYLPFESPYSYTRLGRVVDAAELPRVLGPGAVRITFTEG